MPGPPSEPVALPPPRRRGRSSAQKSTGLDYTSCHRVDEDISSRIRSLLLSRNIRRPPRTPNSSEDCEQHSVLLGGDKEPDTRFDFSSSKSVATSAFHQFPVPRMDVASKRLLRTDGPSEDEVAAAELQPPLLQRLGLRKSSSANDVGGPSNDGAGPKDNADADNPETEVERMKFCLGLPKLVLQDQPTPDYEPVLSCGHPASANDRSGVGTNCISRTDTGVSQPFTCEGESGCSLGPGKCLRHRRQSSQPAKMPKTDHLRKSDIAAVAHVISEDVAKLGLLIKSMAGSDSSEATESGITSPVESAPVEASEPVSSKSSKPSVSSVTFKPQTPSLLSGASRGSSKHSLLKSSIKSATPVDTATPAPPILSPPPVYASGDILEPRHENKFESLAQIVSEGEEEKEENAEYWGFLPVVKDAVKEAVQEAVKRAVNEALIPAGVKKHQTNPAYRKLVGESLLKAAKDADEDLQSPPKEAETEPTQRASWQAIAPWTKGYKSISPKEVSDEQPVESKSTIEQPQSFESRGFGSYESTEADWSEKALTSKRAISTGGDRDVEDSKSTASNKSADLKSSLKKAVPWLKELIKPEGGYEARFTKLPTRKHRDWKGHAKLPPKQDTPAIEVTKPLPVIHVPDSDMFSKTIDDLETLLTEAMLIARQTADGEDREYIPRLLCSATAVLKDGRRELEDEDTVRDASTARILSMAYAGSDHGSVEGSIHSMHESLQGSSSESELSDEEDEKQRQHLQTLPHADVAKLPSGISISTQLTQSMYPARTSAPDTSNPRKLSTKVDPVADEIINTNPFGSQPKTIRKVSTDKFSPGQTTRVATGVKTPYLETTKEDIENVETKSPPQAEVVEKRRSKNDKPAKKASESSSSALQSTMESLNPPSIQLRESSLKLRNKAKKSSSIPAPLLTQVTIPEEDYGPAKWPRSCTESFDGNSYPSDALDFDTEKADGTVVMSGGRGNDKKEATKPKTAEQANTKRRHIDPHMFNLRGKRHVSLDEEHHRGFSLTRSHKKQTIARDWAPARKRFVATVACISTALIGILVGIYAAEVPAIQYYVVDFHHYIILGNVFFFIGLAISTFFFWPLPLLHGRKPYILGSMCLAMPLLFPQALAVGEFRSPYEAKWRVALLLPRAVMGFTLGFANMNFKATLTDLFGASLQSSNPHQEVADHHDVRRHGGGLGVWLGIWTWCTIGSIGIGFLLGASIINSSSPAWGFYISICIIAFVLLLNVVCPEVRRAAFRRSVAEVKDGKQVTRRVARGEIKMHMVQSGPKWWGEEFYHGIRLSAIMLRQPGFLVLAFYVAWIYGQIVLIIVLLGSLTSKYYNFKSPLIGASVAAIPLGALLSIPFQKAGLFSRDRTHATTTDDDTRDKRVGCSSHLIRRAIFVLCLPFAGLAYTLSSNGPPIPWILPIIFAGLIGFLSNLALSECHGIIMETFDISDLQPGMTGRPRRSKYDNQACKRTNYSSFPRVSSAFAITQSLGYCIAAAATGVGGIAQRHLGQQVATAVVAGVLLILSILLLGVLVRFREIQIIPDLHKEEMLNFMEARRRSAYLRGEVPDDDDIRPTIIGNPTHITRRMCVLEMGGMTRWSEIRRKNHLVDRDGLEAAHPNLAVMRDIERRIKHKESEIAESIRRMSAEGKLESFEMDEGGDLGAYREGAAKQKEKRAARSKSRGMTKTKTG